MTKTRSNELWAPLISFRYIFITKLIDSSVPYARLSASRPPKYIELPDNFNFSGKVTKCCSPSWFCEHDLRDFTLISISVRPVSWLWSDHRVEALGLGQNNSSLLKFRLSTRNLKNKRCQKCISLLRVETWVMHSELVQISVQPKFGKSIYCYHKKRIKINNSYSPLDIVKMAVPPNDGKPQFLK